MKVGSEMQFRFGEHPRHKIVLIKSFIKEDEKHWVYLASDKDESLILKTADERVLKKFYSLNPEYNWVESPNQ